jgi:DNA-binding response OmpR family regulator
MYREGIAEKRILIVEDDYMIAREIADFLGNAGAHVVGPVPTVASALNALGDTLPDAAILDIMLDDETSYPLANLFSERGIPFVFATAYADMIPQIYRHVRVFEKPLALPELARSVTGSVQEQRSAGGRSYGVRRVDGAWEWRVYANDQTVARGREATSLHARVAALEHMRAMRLH